MAPKVWKACRAKEQEERKQARSGGNAGAGWQRSGKPSGEHVYANPKPKPTQPAPRVTVQPKRPKGTAASQSASLLTPATMHALVAQVLADLGKKGMAGQDVIQVGEALKAVMPSPEVRPQEQQDAEKQWAQRLNHAHRKLRQWQQQLAERREALRQAKRQMESAEAHVEYWERTLAAATSKDSNWEHRETFVDVDFDFDSQAGDTAEHDDPGDEESTSAGNSDMQLSMDTTPVTAAPTAVYPSTAASPFQHTTGSAFLAGGGSSAPANDALAAAHAQMALIREQGAKYGIPVQMLEQAATEGHSLDLIVSSFHLAKAAGELLILKQQPTD